MIRAALLVAAALAAACSQDPPQTCPGQPAGRFTFDATLAATPLAAGLDPDPALTDCAALGHQAQLPPFEGTLAFDAATTAGALCRDTGLVMFGTHSGARWVVEVSSDGAVLGACGPTCAATSRVVISGDVAEARFGGALVEQLTPSEGACDACALPCAARYDLTGTAVSP